MKDKHHMISGTCGIEKKKKTNKSVQKTDRPRDIENKHDYQRGGIG